MVRAQLVGTTSDALPVLLRMAGHELRWQLLRELAHSDLRVRELEARLDQPQNVISYHLGKLRSAGLATMRRSSADGRDVYYHLDLDRCAELLGDTAAALHPSLHSDADSARDRPGRRAARVLFLCSGNSARSPMAAELMNQHTAAKVTAFSAGSRPRPIQPQAVLAMRDYGIDLSTHRPHHVDEYLNRRLDYVITLCDRAREVCPEFPDSTTGIHWSIPDPSSEPDGDAAYRRTAAELDRRIRSFLPVISAPPREVAS